MSRTTVYRNLPPLKLVLKHFSEFPKGKSRQQVMTEELRNATKRLRGTNSQPFYSMSSAADFFHAPISTILPVYRTLEREGILSRIRGSRTMLNGKVPLPREPLRGVVGIPLGMPYLVLLPYTQMIVVELEERLGRMGYIADIVFDLSDFATGLLRRNLDAVIMQSPRLQHKQDILSLQERGVRMLSVQRTDTQFEVPGLIYLQDYRTAYRLMAARWHQIGIRKTWLCTTPEYLDNISEIANMRKIMNQHGIDAEAFGDEPSQLLEKVRKHKLVPTGVAFLDSVRTELICNREPEVIEKISKLARLAFCVGRIRLPGLQFRKVRADIIEFSPIEVAARLADDISRLSMISDGVCHTFVAAYNEQALL